VSVTEAELDFWLAIVRAMRPAHFTPSWRALTWEPVEIAEVAVREMLRTEREVRRAVHAV
jgi:hypothetical protein